MDGLFLLWKEVGVGFWIWIWIWVRILGSVEVKVEKICCLGAGILSAC